MMRVRLFVEVEWDADKSETQGEPETLLAIEIQKAVRRMDSVVECEAYPIPPLLKGERS